MADASADIRWWDYPLHCLDFEGSQATGVVEYGVVTLRRGEIEFAETALCGTQGPLRAADTQVHGLTEQRLAHAPAFATHFERFAGLREQGLFVAHQASVERNLLKATWAYPRSSAEGGEGRNVTDWGPFVDSRALFETVLPGLDSYKLGDLVVLLEGQEALERLAAEFCPPERRKAHCALYDALALVVLLRALARLPDWAQASLHRFLTVSTASLSQRKDFEQGDLFSG